MLALQSMIDIKQLRFGSAHPRVAQPDRSTLSPYLSCHLEVKMNDSSSRGLLIAILIVVGLNLAVTLVQTALVLRSTSVISGTAVGAARALPEKYTDGALAKIADRVVVPYNKQD